MPDSIAQIGLILLLIVPGYISYSLKEMWVSYREKSQFEKLLNSLMYSVAIWSIFWLFFRKTPRYYLMEGSLPDLIGWPLIFIFPSICILAWIMAKVEQKEYLFWLGETLEVSIKRGQSIPLFEYIFNDSEKEITEIYVYTDDGCIYRGLCREEKGWEILCGSHPYSGDFSFVCDWSKKPNSEGKKTEGIDQDGFVVRTYIPKERIKKVRYRIKK